MRKLLDKNIIVTGGAGFIGSNLCEYLIENNNVTCIDNLSTGRKTNLEKFINHSNFKFIEGDIKDEEFCKDIVQNETIILHNAALGSVPRSIENPLRTNENNITGFLNILDAARVKQAERIIYASSSSTYGDHSELPKIEERIGNPISPYAVTKLCNELYANTFHRTYGLKVVGLRYFNVFGKNQDPAGAYAAAIPRFITAYLNNGEITIFGDGEQTRDFTHVENVIQAIELAASTSNDAVFGQVFNVAFGSRISLNELINTIKEVGTSNGIKSDYSISYLDARIGDIRDSFASIEKANKLLGYTPKISLKEGLNKMITEGY